MPWFWLLLAFGGLVFFERWIHRHLQGVWLLAFNSEEVAIILYSLVLLPGVFLHEASHWLMATLLGVRASHFSVVPERMPDNTLRLGYVETERMDFVREALIGSAPLLAGTLAVLWLGYSRLDMGPVGAALARGDLLGFGQSFRAMLQRPDAWLWLYLTFAVSNSMLPSASDRRAWPLVALVAVVIFLGLSLAGFGPALTQALTRPVNEAVRALAGAFSITLGLDVLIAPFIALMEWFLVRLTGRQVIYS